jgi:hypothetical protein
MRDRAHLKRHHRPASMAVAPCLIRLTLRLQSISKTLLHDLLLVTAIRVRLDLA